MERIEKFITVKAPLRAVYNQWTQFEEFPKFMEGVEEVRQLDDKRLFWRAKIWGKTFGADYRCLRVKGLTFTSLEPLSWSASEGKSQLKEQ